MGTGMLALAAMPASTPTWLLVVLMIPLGLSGPSAIPVTTAVLLEASRRTGPASRPASSTPAANSAAPWPLPPSVPCSPNHPNLLIGLRESLVIAAAVASLLLKPTTRP